MISSLVILRVGLPIGFSSLQKQKQKNNKLLYVIIVMQRSFMINSVIFCFLSCIIKQIKCAYIGVAGNHPKKINHVANILYLL